MADKTFSIVFDASMNVSQMTGAVKKIQSEFNKLQIGGSFQKKITNLLVELDSAIKDFETKSGKEITSKRDIGEIESATRKIVNLYERLKIEAKTLSSISNKELQKLFPEDLEKNFKQVETYLGKYRELVEKNNKEIENKQRELKQAQEKLTKTQQKDAAKGKKKITAAEMRDLKNSQSQINKQRKKQQESIAQLEEEKNKRIESGSMRIKKDGTADKRYGDATENQDLLDRIQQAQTKLAELNESYNQVSNKISGSITETDYNENLKKIEGDIQEAQKAIADFEKEITDLKANPQVTESFENLRKEVEKLTGLDLSNITQDLDGFEKLKQIFDDFQTGKLEEARKKLEELGGAVRNIAPAVDDTEGAVRKTGEAFSEMSREAQDLARLQDQVLDFFSLSNTIQIFKNAIRDAFETVKELDAVMTETAVVTDFSIGDMWDKLPEYSTEANKLGTSIKSLYEATTLYYQQGLNSDQAMDVGIETMKMARIANMDAAAATEAMTAALRGFNMEINETNATRINDVYSELAAITAADTEQIATAMSKTASIADAANMEFETTAAFLAQIIETTQEAPETAGTAMKTIIARFTEVKELFDEGMLSGKDAEGEEININKIDAALKKVGISLNDFLKGEKGIDDIFLELASKWDTLDLATQRYIATTAAGSRQQSRFLAMMSNYDRTMELVTAANNSAGASQKQFDKTLESLEAKLQRLNNAWQEFTMGLANNEVIKAGVDLLTWLLETINKITGVAGNEGLGGMITMFARLATVISALRGGGAIIKNLIGGMVKTGVFSKNTLGSMGLDETGNWIKDISLLKILMNTLNVTTTESGILFGKLGIEISKAGAAGASSGAAVTIGWLPVIGIITAIIVVVWALVAAFRAAHAASPEGRLEAASAAADSAAEAAEGAAQAYEHLAAALGSIGGKSAVLENLAVGTTEWKNAVQELNGEVLDLVEQYPELAQFIDSSDGYLKLNMEGSRVIDGEEKTAKDILSDYQENKFKAQSASAAAKLQEQQAKIDLDYSKLDNNIKITPKIDIPEYDPLYYSTQISQLQGGPYSQERTQKINAIQKEWAEAEKAYNEAKVKEANALFSPETRELTDKVAKAIASNQIEGFSMDEKTKNKTAIVDGESYTFDDNRYDKLREYGKGLVAEDAAAKVFIDSLLSNALMTSEVSEEQKSNMMSFFNSDQVESMLETEKINLKEMDEVKWEAQKEAYAKAMGYTYSDGNIYKGEAIAANKLDLTKDSLIEQIAGMNVTDSISGTMDKLAPKLSQLDDSQAKLISAFSSQNLDNLTIGEIDDLISELPGEKMAISEVANKLGYEGADAAQKYAEDLGYQDLDVFEQDIEKFKAEAEKQKSQITKDFDDLTGQENWVSENLADASYSTLNGLKEQASQMAPDAAREYLNSFAETVKNEDLSEQDQKALQSYLSNMDWSDMSQAINAMDYMQQMGLDSSAIKEFWKVATDGANTYMSSMSQALALTEKFQGKVKQVDEIEEALADGKATNEQMQQLIDAGIDVSNFELTADGWKATKEQIEEATRKLREYNAEQARAAADRQAEEIREMKSQARSSGFFFDEEGNLGASERVIKNSNGAIQRTNSGEIISGTVTKENMAWVSNLLDLSKDDEETDDDFVARLQAALNDFISGLNNAEAIQAMVDKATALAEAAVYTTDENVQRGGSAESVRMSMQQEAKDLGLDSEEVTKYAEAVQNAKDLTSQTAAQIAIDYARMAQGMEEITSKWDEWKEKISMDNDMEKAFAFEEMAASANKMLGVTDILDAEFVSLKENMDLIKQAAKGDADAFNKLQKAAVQKGLDKLKKDLPKNAKNFEKVNKALDQTTKLAEDLSNIEVDVGETFSVDPKSIDVNSISGQLTQLYNNAYAAALEGGASVAEAQSAANAAIEAAGYEAPEMEVQEVTVTGSAPDTMIPNITAHDAGNLGPQYEVNYTTAEGEETSQTVSQFVPKGSGGFTKKSETVNAKGKGGGGGGGGGGSEWENSIDKLYNVQENIDRTVREREQIERRYQRLLDRRLATAQELQRVSQSEIESLREQAKYQQQMVEGRQQMLQDEMEENAELKKYATVNVETGQITIDWELINSVTDEEEGSAIEDYLSKLEELRDSMHEAQDALEDINDAVWEIEERGREEYLEFEDRIKEALIEVRQKEIDTLEEINESINDTNDKLLDSIQQSIDKMRQDRENERTEEDLQEKQRRLAYLEQDTSNANAMEILELRREIEEGQEDYTDTLIDQKISELQEQNDKAAEQREKQITLLQNQLDWEIESGRIWQVVEALMQDGLDPQGGLIRGSMLEQILKDGEQWTGLSDIGQMNWLLDLETMIAESMNWRMTKGQLENLHEKKTDQEIEFINSKGEKLTGTVDEKGQVWTGKDTYYKDVYQWIDGTYHTTESEATKYVAPKPEESKTSTGSSKKKGGGKTYPYQAIVDGVPLKGSYSTPEEAAAAVAKAIETNGGKSSGEVTNYTSGETKGRVVEVEGEYFTDISGEIEKIKKYKTGGLADFTGPAWLDGTKSRPELVLNQRDTQNFIQLKDILSSIMTRNFSSAQTPTENNGDITYDIDINVETMGSDYDVEQVANKVKSMINEDARYRNNNAISLKR